MLPLNRTYKPETVETKETICQFADLRPGNKFIFRDRDNGCGGFMVAIRTVYYKLGKVEETFVVDLYTGQVIENVNGNEIVARMKYAGI